MQFISANTCMVNNVKSLQGLLVTSDKPTWCYKIKVLYLKYYFVPCIHIAHNDEDNRLFRRK